MTTPEPGPVARKLIAECMSLRSGKVLDLSAFRQSKKNLEAMAKHRAGRKGATPEFSAYADGAELAMHLLQGVHELREMKPLAKMLRELEDEYMPGYPPMSPITDSWFYNWVLWDLPFGKGAETVGGISLDVARALGMDPFGVSILETLTRSRPGFFYVESASRKDLVLRELVTGETRPAVCSSGHRGAKGEIWLARVVPPPWPETKLAVVQTTPYVVLEPDLPEWEKYFARALPKTGLADPVEAYVRHMKVGPEPRAWLEYPFEGFVNFTEAAIFLRGLPDVAESRPQSRVNRR